MAFIATPSPVMLSYSFLVWLEVRERQQRTVRGRPRGLFPQLIATLKK